MRFKQKDRIGADGRPTGSGREHGIRARIFIGLALFAALVGIVGGWAARAELSRAVIAPGVLVVDSHVKKIQHRTGGIVGEIYFRDGDQVQAGDVVLRLDDTITRANHRLVTKALTELATRKARLEAERDGADEVVVPAELASRMNDPQVAHVVAGERRLFSLRQAA
ncbi:MAG: biotin/lipoyl-binding protein, partial [Hyphomicrobium sp.]